MIFLLNIVLLTYISTIIRPRTYNGSYFWRPGFARNLHFLRPGALVLAFFCIAACVAVLVISDSQPISSWRVQPTVLLVIFSTVANTVLAFALAEGVTLSWWKRALDGGTLRGLHEHYKSGTSVWASLSNIRRFNMVGFACIMTMLVAVDGPLLQRASSVTTQVLEDAVAIQATIAPELPNGYTVR